MSTSKHQGPFASLRTNVEEVLLGLRAQPASGRSRDFGPLLDTTIQSISETLARWQSGATMRRWMGGLGRDVLTRLGSPVELSVVLGPLAKLGAERARFYVGGEQLTEVPILRHKRARSVFHATEAGVFSVELEFLRNSGVIVSPRSANQHGIAQVVDAQPVVLVDAELVLARTTTELVGLKEYAEAGIVLAYFDTAETERSALIREAVTAHGLPLGAVLVHPAQDVEIDTLGIDFRRVFVIIHLRRLLARGVPVVSIVSTADFRSPEFERIGILVQSLGDIEVARERGDGSSSLRQRALDFEETRKARDPLSFRLDYASDSQLVAGHRVQLELDNKRARERLFQHIEEAKIRIHLQFYMLIESRFSEMLVVRLVQAARRGVEVRLLVDALYSGEKVLGRTNPLITSLSKEPGIQVVASAPIERAEDLEMLALKRRDHRKLAIFDGRCAFVSGRNAGDAYYTGFDEVPIHDHTHHERIPWLDAHVEIEGPLVSRIEACFLQAFGQHGGHLPTDTSPTAPPTGGTASARLVVHHGTQDANGLGQYEAMIDSAKDHLYIVNDFPIVASLSSALLCAARRGVSIKLLTGNGLPRRADGSFFPGPLHRELFELMVKQRLEPLIEGGVQVFEAVISGLPDIVSQGGLVRPYVHAKILTVDGRAASVGSANLDATASYWEDETNLVVEDSEFTLVVEAELERLISRALPVDPRSDYWEKESTQRAIVSRLWPESMYS